MPTSHSDGIVERLTCETRRFVAASGGEIPSLGRGRARLAESLRSGPRWLYARSATKEGAALATVAKDVEIERIALPPKAAIIDPSEVILQARCPERAAVTRDLRQLELPFSNWPSPTLKPCHRIGVDDEIKFARILVEEEMGHLVPDCEVPRGPDGKALVGGWFGVDHTQNRIRLIFDRRPQKRHRARPRLGRSPLRVPTDSCRTRTWRDNQGIRGRFRMLVLCAGPSARMEN